jgi:glycosyltransferase involved in cell wall biosynthesis
MRIALDATPLLVPQGGIARYVEQLSRALAAEYPEDEVYWLSDQPVPAPPAPVRAGARPRTAIERRWWLIGLPRELRRLRAELFHGTDFGASYRRVCPCVMSVHDLSPWLDPSWHRDAERVRRRTPWLLRLRRATLVLTHTEAVRWQTIRHFGLDEERVRAVPLAAAPVFAPAPPLQRPRPYFLYVGTLEPRKNIPLLIEAWRAVRSAHEVDLLLAGRRRDDGPAIPDEPGLEWLGPVEDAELPPLICGAVAALYPSHYEGFGLPALEAMQCGAAVIASTDPSLVEAGGGAPLHVPAGDVRAWREAMTAMLAEPHSRRERQSLGLARAAQFSWARTARETRAVYEEAVRIFHG